MKTSNNIQIERALKVLIGLQLWDAGRSGNLEWFQFGKRRELASLTQITRVVGEYALHVQCGWRIIGPNGIVVASQDRHYPAESLEESIEDFEWDRQGANRCDERIAQFFDAHKASPVVVKDVKADYVGSLRLFLSDEFIVDIFPDNSLLEEHWRFFRPGRKTKTLVFTGQGIER